MTRRKRPVDKVRASRDGHEYHEAWTARKAMQLLGPDSGMIGIAVEGLSPTDQAGTSAEVAEVADIAVYYGSRPNFERASRTSIVQFKYSIADKNSDFRASHAKKTIAKFATTYKSFKTKYGTRAVHVKLDFELVTNRPIYKPLLDAIGALAKGVPPTGEAAKQAAQFRSASGLDGKGQGRGSARRNQARLQPSRSAPGGTFNDRGRR